MKPVESYSAINTRLDRPSVQEGTARKVGGPVVSQNTENAKAKPAIMTTASLLAAKTPPFDSHKVAEVRQKIAAGIFDVDTAALAKKMLDMGVFGTESDK